MYYKDTIISSLADRECKRICGKTIRALQRMTEGMQSGTDASLKNIWDEVCVQVQFEQSLFWDAYLDIINAIISREVNKLDTFVKQAIWFQTVEGSEWECEDEAADEAVCDAPYLEDDITDYILDRYVLSRAADWSNPRIEKYLE